VGAWERNALINLILIKHLDRSDKPLKITRVDEVQISANSLVTVTQMNHILEVQHMEKKNDKCHIKKLDSDRYVEIATGEIKDFHKTENRSQGLNSLRQTFKKLRYLINNNFTGSPNELFLTLTYKNQTKDHLQVGKDYDGFLRKLKRHYKEISTIDALKVLEPHATGNYHMHVLLRFNDLQQAYIPTEKLAEIWGLGFVKIQSLKGVDNVGAYLSAYMADLEVPDDYEYPHENLEEKVVNGHKKKFIKGGRLAFYPTGVNLYSKTKGIVYPEREDMSYSEAKKIVGAATPHYKKSLLIADEEKDFSNTITYEQYNLKRQ